MSRLLALLRPMIRRGCRRRASLAIHDAGLYVKAMAVEPPDTTRHALLEAALAAAQLRAQVWLGLSGDGDVTAGTE